MKMVFYKEQDNHRPPLSLILPYLYLGAETDVTQDCLTSQGITYVLSVSRCCPQPAFLPQKQYLRIPIDDSLRDELLPWIPEALQFIDEAMSRGCSVLVHCVAGVSRSPALAVAYVMYRLGLGLDDAYRFVKERRPSISPNFNFLGQLQSFQGTLAHKGCGANQNVKPVVAPGDCARSISVISVCTGKLLSANQNVHIQNNSFSGICLEGVKLKAHSDCTMVDNLNQSSTSSNCTEREGNRPSPASPNFKHHQQKGTKLTLALSDKLRALTLIPSANEAGSTHPTHNQDQSAFRNSHSKPQRPAQLDITSTHVSLSEKRKSLKLSLTPLSLDSQTPQTTEQELGHNRRDQQWQQTDSSKAMQSTQAGPSNSIKKQGKNSQGALPSGENGTLPRRRTQQTWGMKTSAKSQREGEATHSSVLISASTEADSAASSTSAHSGLNFPDSPPQTQPQYQHISTNQRQGAPNSHCAPAMEAIEGLDVERIPLSPLSLTVNKLLGWGERMLLGVLLGPRVKVGQAALPYRC